MTTMRGAPPVEMSLLHVTKLSSSETPDSLAARRFGQADLILTTENPEDLKDLQRAMAAHVLPGLQRRLNGTIRNLSQKK